MATKSRTPKPTQAEGIRKCGGRGACDRHTIGFVASGSDQYSQPWRKPGLAPRANSPPPTPTIFRAQSSPSVLNSKAWILMITFQAQGFREFGSVLFWFFTLIREPAKLVLRVPFPIRFPPKKSLWGAWALTGVFRGSLSLVPGRKGGGGYLGKVEKQQGEESTATKPSATGERTGLKTQVRSELPRHSADDHGGTLKRPIGGPRGSLGKVPVPRKPQTGRRGNHA